jgi:hypothetical protein
MIKLFRNVTLLPNAMYTGHDMLDQYDSIVIEELDAGFGAEPSTLVAYNQTYLNIVDTMFNGSESDFFKHIAHYSPDKNLAIFASNREYARILLQFLVSLYPKATDEMVEKLYYVTLDKLSLILDKLVTFNDDQRRKMILESYVTSEDLKNLIYAVRLNPVPLDQGMKMNLAFEWLYFDYLINGTDSEYLEALTEQSKNFIYPQLIMYHDAVCSMNNLTSQTSIPLKLTQELSYISNLGRSWLSAIDSAEIGVDTFVKKYGEHIKSVVEDSE